MSSYSREQLEKWIRELPPIVGSVIDIGGSQLPVIKRLMNTSIMFEEYKILDLAVPHECKVKPDFVCDLNEVIPWYSDVPGEDTKDAFGFDNGVYYPRKSFDHAFCLEVSEYWWNPVQALKNINLMLKMGGTLYISFHFIYPVHNPPGEDNLRYTTDGALTLLEKCGFDPMLQPRLMTEKGRNIIGDFYREERMRPSKEYDSHNWSGSLIIAKKIKEM